MAVLEKFWKLSWDAFEKFCCILLGEWKYLTTPELNSFRFQIKRAPRMVYPMDVFKFLLHRGKD